MQALRVAAGDIKRLKKRNIATGNYGRIRVGNVAIDAQCRRDFCVINER